MKLFLLFTLLVSQQVFAQSATEIMKRKNEGDSLINTTVYGKNKSVGKFYDIRGFKMYCETYGEGAPLLIIHGNGGSISDFVKQIPYFSKKYKIIIADSRAQGRSADNTNDSLSYEMMADDYAALLTALHIDSANVIGWSDGGIEGLLLAIRHPEKVRKLAVTGANLQPDTIAVDAAVVAMVEPVYERVEKMKDTSLRVRTVRKLYRLLVREPHIPVADLHTIRVPTLVIGGDHDVINVPHTVQIFQSIPNAYLWILPNSGHSTPIIYTDEFNAKVDMFFQSPYRRIAGEARFY